MLLRLAIAGALSVVDLDLLSGADWLERNELKARELGARVARVVQELELPGEFVSLFFAGWAFVRDNIHTASLHGPSVVACDYLANPDVSGGEDADSVGRALLDFNLRKPRPQSWSPLRNRAKEPEQMCAGQPTPMAPLVPVGHVGPIRNQHGPKIREDKAQPRRAHNVRRHVGHGVSGVARRLPQSKSIAPVNADSREMRSDLRRAHTAKVALDTLEGLPHRQRQVPLLDRAQEPIPVDVIAMPLDPSFDVCQPFAFCEPVHRAVDRKVHEHLFR